MPEILGGWCEIRPLARARDFSPGQGAKPQAYWSISRILQRRAGEKGPLAARDEFYTRLLDDLVDWSFVAVPAEGRGAAPDFGRRLWQHLFDLAPDLGKASARDRTL